MTANALLDEDPATSTEIDPIDELYKRIRVKHAELQESKRSLDEARKQIAPLEEGVRLKEQELRELERSLQGKLGLVREVEPVRSAPLSNGDADEVKAARNWGIQTRWKSPSGRSVSDKGPMPKGLLEAFRASHS
jgi:hypothetical protein